MHKYTNLVINTLQTQVSSRYVLNNLFMTKLLNGLEQV